MIKTQAELKDAQRRLLQLQQNIAQAIENLKSKGLEDFEIDKSIAGLLQEQQQIQQEIAWFRQAKLGQLVKTCSIKEIGSLLISCRLARGLTQKELARLLNVSPAQVSKDEQSNYRGLSFERAIKILDALDAKIDLTLNAGEVPKKETTPVSQPAKTERIEQDTQAAQDSNPDLDTPQHQDAFQNLAQLVGQEVSIPKVESIEPPQPVTKLLLTVGIKGNPGQDQQVQKAVARIEEELLIPMHAKKLSSSQKFFALEAVYELPLVQIALDSQLATLNEQCLALATQEKCWAKIVRS